MKWALITTRHTNPGDEFARMGVQRLIHTVDSEPEFVLVNKEGGDINRPFEFDRAVLCGMPLFWNLPVGWPLRDCRDIHWWGPLIRGWLSEDPKKFACIGVGDVLTPEWDPVNSFEFDRAVQEAWKRGSFMSLRAPLPGLGGPRVSCCPSAFEFMEHGPNLTGPSVCNLMVNGGHFHHPESEWMAWRALERPLSNRLRDWGFVNCAHNLEEYEHARDLGWPTRQIFFSPKAEDYADFYKTARMFVGNRVHGGAVCAARGVPSWVVTYDSRLRMAERLGAKVSKPSQFSIDGFKTWFARPPTSLPQVNIYEEFRWTADQLRKMG